MISSYVRQSSVASLCHYVGLSTMLVLQLAALRREGGWGVGNGHLVALTNCYSKHPELDLTVSELGKSFPIGFTWGQSVPARAACWTRTDSAGPANARVCLLLTAQAATRFCSPAARQELYKRYFEKDRQQHLKGWTKFPAGTVLLE